MLLCHQCIKTDPLFNPTDSEIREQDHIDLRTTVSSCKLIRLVTNIFTFNKILVDPQKNHRFRLQLKSQVPLGMCYCVDQHQKARDQAVEVLEHYNVVVTKRDIFSRCQVQMSSCFQTSLLTDTDGRAFWKFQPINNLTCRCAMETSTC